MNNICSLVRLSTITAIFLGLFSTESGKAEETDFSCMEQSVLAKTMVTQRYKEFDIVLKNECRGTVNWTMCIEKTDPFTHRVIETLTPSGTIERDKKFRINMQMDKQEDQQNKLEGYEEFYVNVVYDINSMLTPRCIARQCESQKKPLRDQIRANQRSLQKVQSAIDKKVASECPRSGWSDMEQEKCQTRIEKESQANIQALNEKDRELNQELASIDPELCETH